MYMWRSEAGDGNKFRPLSLSLSLLSFSIYTIWPSQSIQSVRLSYCTFHFNSVPLNAFTPFEVRSHESSLIFAIYDMISCSHRVINATWVCLRQMANLRMTGAAIGLAPSGENSVSCILLLQPPHAHNNRAKSRIV
ncbi:hypothetical protein PM082_004447 [Marasmius tenuissimus]|nr:hypothetical protein PM082_004447 [Marasmius tenuissimus]